jgi:hypothetical protein
LKQIVAGTPSGSFRFPAPIEGHGSYRESRLSGTYEVFSGLRRTPRTGSLLPPVVGSLDRVTDAPRCGRLDFFRLVSIVRAARSGAMTDSPASQRRRLAVASAPLVPLERRLD